MAKATSELASTPTQPQASLSFKKQPAKKARKEPEVYIFRLCEEHPKSHEGASIFPPIFIIPNKDTVLFNYGTSEEPNFMPRQIRYLDGHKTIFVDEQEEKGPVPETVLTSPRNTITFETGHLVVPSWNKPLYEFLTLSNQCEQNTNKLRQVKNIFRLIDLGGSDEDIIELGKKKDRAYDVARSASVEEMIPHAKFLGISFAHPSTGAERDFDAIREDYKAKALENPEKFLLYANNPKVKIQYLVERGLNEGVISTDIVKGQVHWVATKQFAGLIQTDKKAIDAVVDFASTDEGEAFMRTLRIQLNA